MKKEIVDQTAHFLAALAVIFFASLTGAEFTVASGAVVGLSLGIVREVTEGGNVVSKGSLLDMLFWLLGGLAGGYTF